MMNICVIRRSQELARTPTLYLFFQLTYIARASPFHSTAAKEIKNHTPSLSVMVTAQPLSRSQTTAQELNTPTRPWIMLNIPLVAVSNGDASWRLALYGASASHATQQVSHPVIARFSYYTVSQFIVFSNWFFFFSFMVFDVIWTFPKFISVAIFFVLAQTEQKISLTLQDVQSTSKVTEY